MHSAQDNHEQLFMTCPGDAALFGPSDTDTLTDQSHIGPSPQVLFWLHGWTVIYATAQIRQEGVQTATRMTTRSTARQKTFSRPLRYLCTSMD